MSRRSLKALEDQEKQALANKIKPEDLRPAMVWMNFKKGMSFKAIAEFFEANVDTVSSAIKRFKETGSFDDRPRSGRPSSATNGNSIRTSRLSFFQIIMRACWRRRWPTIPTRAAIRRGS
jgi:hypothetical protein